jgi:peptidoglycan/LPS O-acetylase OafA/YrhL
VARASHWGVLIGLVSAPLLFAAPPFVSIYGLHFAVGVSLWLERERIASAVARLPTATSIALACGALASLAGPMLLAWHVPSRGILEPNVADPRAVALMAPGAAGLIALALGRPGWRRWLEARPVLFLGRISYSLYMLHIVVLVLCTRVVEPSDPLSGLALLGLVMALSVALSALFHRTVERPAIALGNRACGVIAERAGTRALRSAPPG